MRHVFLSLVLLGCGTPPPVEEPQGPPAVIPTIGDRQVYDVTTADAAPVIQDAWAAVRALLDMRPPEEAGPRVNWMRDQAHAIAQLEDDLEPLRDGEPRDRLFASAVLASLTLDLYEATRELPAGVDDPDVRASFENIVATFGLAARGQFMRCAAVEGLPEVLSGWPAYCAERAQSLELLMPVDPTVEICAAEEEYVERAAPPRDESAPLELVVLPDENDERFTGRDRERLLTAVHRRLDTLREERLVPLAEVRTAERLVSERRLVANGPQCGQAPTLATVLAQRHPNLMFVSVSTNCQDDTAGTGCSLAAFGSYVNEDAVEMIVSTEVTGNASSIATWTRAAGRLAQQQGAADVARGRGGSRLPDGLVYRVRDTNDDDPLLRIGPTVRGEAQTAMVACAPEGGPVGVYSVDLALAANGTVESAAVTVEHSRPGADGPGIAACIEQAIRAQGFPCTSNGQPARASFRVCLGHEQSPQ